MGKSLQQYIHLLDEREDLIWPKLPDIQPVKATPSINPLPGIRAVTWSIYGTLLRISEGKLLFFPEDTLRIQVALDKTIREFNMWYSMSRKPGAPWEYMFQQYKRLVEDRQMVATAHKGDIPEVDSSDIWLIIIERLLQKEYEYDVDYYGNLDELAQKVAYFFHSNLQGVAATNQALRTLQAIASSSMRQGLLANAQPFSVLQMLRALAEQGTLPPLGQLFDAQCLTLSFVLGIRKPSKSLYKKSLDQFRSLGIGPEQILHVGSQLTDDLIIAKQLGMRTVLYAGDKNSLQASQEELADPNSRPDRLVTELSQLRDILEIG